MWFKWQITIQALHGDPDILENGKTRFGTALALLVLERYKGGKSFFQCLKLMNFDGNILNLRDLLKDSDIRNYVFRNFLFEVSIKN